MISTVITAIKLFGVGKSAAFFGIAVLALGTIYGVWHHTVWERGYAKAIADIAQQDQKAINRASSARSVVLDCKSRGLRWDQSTGLCERR